jgi:hypothetical protein
VKRPVLSFEAEVLTDAPCGHIVARLREGGPGAFRCLRPFRTWADPEEAGGGLVLRWTRSRLGAEESGELTVSPDPKGARLQLAGRMKGWSSFLWFGLLRWQTDRILDRFVEEL